MEQSFTAWHMNHYQFENLGTFDTVFKAQERAQRKYGVLEHTKRKLKWKGDLERDVTGYIITNVAIAIPIGVHINDFYVVIRNYPD